MARSGRNAEQLLSALTKLTSTVDVEAASAANTVLMITFTELLSNLISAALMGRLPDSAASGKHEQKNAQEQKR